MKLRSILYISIALFAVAHCKQILSIAHYNAIPLDSRASLDQISCQNALSFSYRVFNANDCEKYLGRKKIIAKGYQPVQITISNDSQNSFDFSLDSINIPQLNYQSVIEDIKFSTGKRIAVWGIPGIFIWPFLIPAAIEAVSSPKANHLLEIDLENKALKSQIIPPYSSINGIVFFPTAEFKRYARKKKSKYASPMDDFSFCLVDRKTFENRVISRK